MLLKLGIRPSNAFRFNQVNARNSRSCFSTPSIFSIILCLALLSILSYFPTTLINCFRYPKLVKDINSVLQRELAGYRFVGAVFTDITNEQKIEMLEQAVDDKNFPAVSSHLKRSLALMSDKENSDYINSIKESISAVESVQKLLL